MKLKIYQADAFSKGIFTGNPAAVCPLTEWLSDELMQNIAMENNLAETAFYVKEKDHYRIRWFTPAVEVDLCGHATLAAAHVLFHHENFKGNEILFESRSGILKVTGENEKLTLDFPADEFTEIAITDELIKGFNIAPMNIFKGKTDYMFVYESEAQVLELFPDFKIISQPEARGIIVTSKGYNVDFVSRFFAPQAGIDEDPVTGSAHTTLTPYWSKILNKTKMKVMQLSKRKGYLECELKGDRVLISGEAVTYLIGEIQTKDKKISD